MSTEVITLGLEQIGREILGSISVIERQRRAERRRGNTPQRTLSNDIPPTRLRIMNSLVKEVIKQEVLQIRVRAVRLCDVLEEDGADDAAAAPHERNLGLVELPAVFLGCVLDEHEALRVRDDLGGVERLLEVVDELGFVAVEGWDGRTLEDLAGAGALGLEGGETSGEDLHNPVSIFNSI